MKWCFALALVLVGFAQRAEEQPNTLRTELRNQGLPLDVPLSVPNLEQKISGGAQLDLPDQFVLAYYLAGADRRVHPPLYLLRFDRKTKTWQSGSIPKANPSGENAAAECLDTVLDLRLFGGGYILETHINPSAGCALLVSNDLQLEGALYGWPLETFSDGILVFHKSQIHFATVHPAEIAVFDPRTKKDFTIFPPKQPKPVRKKLSEDLKAFFETHQDYCAKANDPCDPEYFDSALDGEVRVNNQDHAAAFAISYRLLGYGQDEKKPEGPGRVVYVYRNLEEESRSEVRELTPEELKSRFGDVSLQQLLEPERLKAIFQK